MVERAAAQVGGAAQAQHLWWIHWLALGWRTCAYACACSSVCVEVHARVRAGVAQVRGVCGAVLSGCGCSVHSAPLSPCLPQPCQMPASLPLLHAVHARCGECPE